MILGSGTGFAVAVLAPFITMPEHPYWGILPGLLVAPLLVITGTIAFAIMPDICDLDELATGQRRDQSPATRSSVAVVERDRSFSGAHGPLVKLNPLAAWTSAQTWQYIRENDVPFNTLHERGFVSIGCEPCTRATLPGEHERAGRWWWEEATKRECGLHEGNKRT